MHATHSVTIPLKDGSTVTHTAEALRYWLEADGAVVVEAACCGMVGGSEPCPGCEGAACPRCGGSGLVKKEDRRSRHVFYDIARETAKGLIDPEAEVRAHVQKVAEHHAAVHRVTSFDLDSLMKTS
jgi:hypothetical protein